MALTEWKSNPTKAYKPLTNPKKAKMGISRKWINPFTVGWINWFCLVQFVISSSVCLGGEHTHPCRFNPECLCSTGAAEYGSVLCDGIPMADIPLELQEGRVFKLHLRNNDLHRFPDAKLQGTGMWKLEVSHNQVSSIPPMAFYGLERALWELHLNHNRLIRVPADSIALLKKLTVLNLADNFISELKREDLHSLGTSLKSLDLSGNSLTSVPEAIFWDLQRLEVLDLSRNNIIQIHSMAFQNGVPMLSELNLSDNLMGKIPFVAISNIKSLKQLDLSNNRIEKIEDPFFLTGGIKLDKLILRENNIESLSTKAFVNFDAINYTSLEGNPMRNIDAEAFRDAKIKVLDLSNCFLSSISPRAFKGLERTLEVLDLSANRLKQLPEDLLDDFDLIRKLKLNDNMLTLSPNISFNGFRYSLKDLDLLGQDMSYVPLQEIGVMKNLRTLGLAAVKDFGQVTQSKFQDFAHGLEELHLVNAGLTSIHKNAFTHIPSVSTMDLSNNRIEKIDDDAFKEVGNALQYLKMSNALHFTKLPKSVFHSMTGLITLDLSNNHLRELPLDTFHKMSHLRYLYLQDNEISSFKRGTFHSQANPELRILDLSFNLITDIQYDTFRFPRLERLLLDDNKISVLDSKSFVEMTQLVYLSLEGNQLFHIPDETFQNLHHLSILNLAYNRINQLDFAAFDSVGTLSHLNLDLSHNSLNMLRVNRTSSYPTSSNIMNLDLSCNNISMIEVTFFEPVQNVLKMLNLSRNILSEVSSETFNQLKRLHMLDLSYNSITLLEPGCFISSTKLQSIYLQGNQLSTLSPMLFNNHKKLRVVDLSWNFLETLPEQLFQRTALEILNAANNRLNEIPIKALNPVQSTLKHLDLAGNRITTISDSQLNQIQSLVVLNLANNHITIIDNQAFCCVPNLLWLSLASNPLQRINPDTFLGVRSQLESLNVANASLTLLPSFQLPSLKELNISYNQLTFVPSKTLANLSEVRQLDLSHNELPAPPSSAWHSMHHLRSLSLAGNPITKVLNDSFVGLERLEQLDISDILATTYQAGSLGMMPNLRELKLSIDGRAQNFNLATLLSENAALECLHLHLAGEGLIGAPKKSGSGQNPNFGDGGGVLRHELQDVLPLRLRKIILEGENIENIHPAAFKHLRSRRLELRVVASGRSDLDRDVFLNLGRVQNLSLDVSRPILSGDSLSKLRSQNTPTPPYSGGMSLHQMSGGDVSSNEVMSTGYTGVAVFSPMSDFDGPPHLMGNPVTTYSPNHPRAVFLQDLKIGGVDWICTCDGIGWVEKWLRRWRGIFCSHSAQTSNEGSRSDIEPSGGLSSLTGACRDTIRDLRNAKCGTSKGKNPNQSVLNDIKTTLECDAFSSASKSDWATSKLVLIILCLLHHMIWH